MVRQKNGMKNKQIEGGTSGKNEAAVENVVVVGVDAVKGNEVMEVVSNTNRSGEEEEINRINRKSGGEEEINPKAEVVINQKCMGEGSTRKTTEVGSNGLRSREEQGNRKAEVEGSEIRNLVVKNEGQGAGQVNDKGEGGVEVNTITRKKKRRRSKLAEEVRRKRRCMWMEERGISWNPYNRGNEMKGKVNDKMDVDAVEERDLVKKDEQDGGGGIQMSVQGADQMQDVEGSNVKKMKKKLRIARQKARMRLLKEANQNKPEEEKDNKQQDGNEGESTNVEKQDGEAIIERVGGEAIYKEGKAEGEAGNVKDGETVVEKQVGEASGKDDVPVDREKEMKGELNEKLDIEVNDRMDVDAVEERDLVQKDEKDEVDLKLKGKVIIRKQEEEVNHKEEAIQHKQLGEEAAITQPDGLESDLKLQGEVHIHMQEEQVKQKHEEEVNHTEGEATKLKKKNSKQPKQMHKVENSCIKKQGGKGAVHEKQMGREKEMKGELNEKLDIEVNDRMDVDAVEERDLVQKDEKDEVDLKLKGKVIIRKQEEEVNHKEEAIQHKQLGEEAAITQPDGLESDLKLQGEVHIHMQEEQVKQKHEEEVNHTEGEATKLKKKNSKQPKQMHKVENSCIKKQGGKGAVHEKQMGREKEMKGELNEKLDIEVNDRMDVDAVEERDLVQKDEKDEVDLKLKGKVIIRKQEEEVNHKEEAIQHKQLGEEAAITQPDGLESDLKLQGEVHIHMQEEQVKQKHEEEVNHTEGEATKLKKKNSKQPKQMHKVENSCIKKQGGKGAVHEKQMGREKEMKGELNEKLDIEVNDRMDVDAVEERDLVQKDEKDEVDLKLKGKVIIRKQEEEVNHKEEAIQHKQLGEEAAITQPDGLESDLKLQGEVHIHMQEEQVKQKHEEEVNHTEGEATKLKKKNSKQPKQMHKVENSCIKKQGGKGAVHEKQMGGKSNVGNKCRKFAQKRREQLAKQQACSKADEDSRFKLISVLNQFSASDDQEYTFDDTLTRSERGAIHLLCRKMGLRSKSSGSGRKRCISVYKRRVSEYTFDDTLTRSEGGAIHLLCRKMGLGSKSSGSGRKRCISVYKRRVSGKQIKNNKITRFTLSEEAKDVSLNLFTQYPPYDCGSGDKMVGKFVGKTNRTRKTDPFFARPLMSKFDIKRKLELLTSKLANDPKLKQITKKRTKLPIASFRDAITSAIDSHQVVLISGETGCGKTTQVPQYVLDHVWSKSKTCKIVCTQPRRISAVSVAGRIASERGERMGDSVGYKIKMESEGGRNSSIIFCTTGVLLRLLVTMGSNSLGKESFRNRDAIAGPDGITHIIVDEVHERDHFSDLLLAIVRDLLPSKPNIRLVLMSATIDAERFSQYFGGCPVIRVPGFTYPVKTFYLEDILSILKSNENNHLESASRSVTSENFLLSKEYRAVIDDTITLAWSSDEYEPLVDLVSAEAGSSILNFQHSSTGVTPLMVFARKGRVGELCMTLSLGADCSLQDNDGVTALEWAERENQKEASEILKKHMEKEVMNNEEKECLLDEYLANVNSELVDFVLIEILLKKICTDSTDGAILVFLTGWDDIQKTIERLKRSSFFKDTSKFLLLALHSKVPSIEQKKVFERPPAGCRKIVLSTNIAESSITIDDVVYVINSGRMKEKSYDPSINVSTLLSSWISKASAKQRAGRAGRCQPGICYHLYSKIREASFLDFQVPEVKRMPLEELCLQVKILDPACKIGEFLGKLLDPPVTQSMTNAISVLQELGALSPDEELTELGNKLGSFPVHPVLSKMLFFAILLNCLDPALTLACVSSYRDPFYHPVDPIEKKKAISAKLELASLYGGHGDQLAVIAAFECWKIAQEKGQGASFCSRYFLSPGTMKMVSRMRKKFLSELYRKNFIPKDGPCCSLNAHDPGIRNAVLLAGFYPMVGRLPLPKCGQRAVVETAGGVKVRLNSSSANYMLASNDSEPLIIFDEIIRGDGGLLIKTCSVIGPLPLLLLAKEIIVTPCEEDDNNKGGIEPEPSGQDTDDNYKVHKHKDSPLEGQTIMSSPGNIVNVVVDRWLTFESTALDVAQICCLRERLSAATLFKIRNPFGTQSKIADDSIHSIARILSYDGLSGIPSTLKYKSPQTSETSATEAGQSEPEREKGTSSQDFCLTSLMQQYYAENYTLHHEGKASKSTKLNHGGKASKSTNSDQPAYCNQLLTPFELTL